MTENNRIYRVGIIDDCLVEMALIKRYIAQDASLNIILETSDPLEGLAFLDNNELDILFLDMKMEPLNGVQFLEALLSMPKVIVCSNHFEYAYDTSSYQCAYIRKTIGIVAFKAIIEKIKGELFALDDFVQLSDKMIEIRTSKTIGSHAFVDTEKLMFAEINDKVMHFHLDNSDQKSAEKYVVQEGRLKMNVLEGIIDPVQYARVHRSYMVNLAYVENYSSSIVHIREIDKFVPIGETYYGQFKKSIENWRKSQKRRS